MDQSTPTPRCVEQRIHGIETADGDGVRLIRAIGAPALPELDPFLLLDDIRSDDAADYIGGFPPHPHRGFETVTYLLAGRVRHQDSAGHAGVIESGGVQWMSAGRGVVHSEMPEQQEGLLAGFQLWVNLPAARKMMAPRYQEFGAAELPEERRDGARVKVVAGETSHGTRGPVSELVTPVRYLDVALEAGARFEESLPRGWNAFLYLFEGGVTVAGEAMKALDLAVLSEGERVVVKAREKSRLLLVAGEPINEPIARRGPFVMNTEEELQRAFVDYQEGRM